MNADMMANYVVCAILMSLWRFPRLIRNQLECRWERWRIARPDGKQVTIVGLGGVGRAVAARVRDLGMLVTGVRSSSRPMPGVDRVYGPGQIHEALAEADYIVLALPLTPDTRGLFGMAEFEAMKPTARLINVCRGAVVQEPALIRALQEKKIAGAVLDAFEKEPLPADNPLWQLDSVVISPHLSALSDDYGLRAAEIFGANLTRYLRGQPLLHVVDRERGY
jgi:phosphoglycerate dehydrogenase-like enzyme